MQLFYIFLLPFLILRTVFLRFLHTAHQQEEKPTTIQISITTCLIGLFLFSGIQQIGRFDYFWNQRKFIGKTTEEKKLMLFGQAYMAIQNCQKVLSEFHQGELISDYNMQTHKHMYFHRVLSYHLYPKISLTIDNKTPKDVILAIHKKNALTYIPENYRVLLTTKDQNSVLAIKDRNEK
jgi:hypothetical protein